MANPSSKFNLSSPVGPDDLRVRKVELEGARSPEEVADELAERRRDNAHRRWRETILFAASAVGVATILAACLWLVLTGPPSEADRKWATGVIGLIVGGIIGRYLGRAEGGASGH